MLETVVWAAVVFVLGALVIWRGDRYVKTLLGLERQRREEIEADKSVERLERQNEAELIRRTLNETIEASKADLLLEAARARADAQIAEAPETIQARITEEQQVIAARAEGRAMAAKERAIQDSDQSSDIAVLMEGYTTYIERMTAKGYDSLPTFSRWAESFAPSED